MCIRAGINSKDSEIPYSCSSCYNVSQSTFILHLQRRYLYYLIHLIVPYCLFSLIAVFTFVLQPIRPERLNLGRNISSDLSVVCEQKSAKATRWDRRNISYRCACSVSELKHFGDILSIRVDSKGRNRAHQLFFFVFSRQPSAGFMVSVTCGLTDYPAVA